MPKRSIKQIDLVLSSPVFGSRTLQNFALDGDVIDHGWLDETNYEILQGIKSALAVENPSEVYSISIGIVPDSADDLWLKSLVNNIRAVGGISLAGMFNNRSTGELVTSDEVYIMSAPKDKYTKTPAGKIYQFIFISAIVKNPTI